MNATSTAGRLANSATNKGMMLASLAFFSFVLSDTGNKILMDGYSSYQIMMAIALIGMALIGGYCAAMGKLSTLKMKSVKLHLIRGSVTMGVVYCGINGFSKMPLADAYALAFTAPMISTIMAYFLLKEQVGIHRWSSVILGFVGVLIVALPGWSFFNPASLFAGSSNAAANPDYFEGAAYVLGSAVLFASGNLIVRKYGANETPLSFAFSGLAYVYMPVLLTMMALSYIAPELVPANTFRLPELTDIGWFLWVGLFSTIGVLGLVVAYQLAPASTLGSFHYSQIVWGAAIGYAVFGDVPGSDTLFGAFVIVCSGLYIVYREMVHKQA